MNDLDQRLRHTLHELADTVPPSADAKSGFQRRLVARRRVRGPVLVAAAAVVVVALAGVVVPFALHSTPTAPPAAKEKDDGLVWSRDYDWLRADGGPFVIATFTRDGEVVDVVTWVRGGELCTAEGHHVGVGGSADHTPAVVVGTSCVDVPAWPADQGPGSYVVSAAVLSTGAPDTGPVPGLMLFMTSPEVKALEVRRGDGTYVEVRRFETLGGATLYVADFGSTTQGFGYTARNWQGRVLENAVT